MAKLRPLLGDDFRLTDAVIEAGNRKGNEVHDAIETILKGVEATLPSGFSFLDEGGHRRRVIRTKWCKSGLATYREAYIGPGSADVIPDLPLPEGLKIPEPSRPTFVGHYWFNSKAEPAPVSERVACVDYSVANAGPLVAYRFDGESVLTAEKFVATR